MPVENEQDAHSKVGEPRDISLKDKENRETHLDH